MGTRLEKLLSDFETLKRRYEITKDQLYEAEKQNEKLVSALQDAKTQIDALKEEVDKLCAPPNTYGVFQRANKDGTIEILVDGRQMRVNAHPRVDVGTIQEGQQLVLNEAFNVVEACDYETRGEVVQIKEDLGDGRAVVLGRADEERVISYAGPLKRAKLEVGDPLLMNPRSGIATEKLPKSAVEEVVLEEIPEIGYSDIGGLSSQIEALRDAIELPYLYANEFKEHRLAPPKGILLYGPPGCGKTLIAKAVAHSLAKRIEERSGKETRSYFLNVKGPELLNKYVGETEHKIREVFQKAREKAAKDMPVVLFFDEMDSLFRLRGSGISSDMEATVVAQFLSEIDGVESLRNVIVIGASNRQDLIDPAVLRPGRLDLKIKVARPNEQGAREIFSKYLTPDLPFHEEELSAYANDARKLVDERIGQLVTTMYATSEENKFLEVTYAKGDRETFYFKDFASGAMIENIVARAKKTAVKRYITQGERGIKYADLEQAVADEYKENEDLPNTTNPDDWARISGAKGERIVNVRTLITGINRNEKTIENVTAGQYL
ncbi:MAG: proteasome ATPase [Myxococcota bacterium]